MIKFPSLRHTFTEAHTDMKSSVLLDMARRHHVLALQQVHENFRAQIRTAALATWEKQGRKEAPWWMVLPYISEGCVLPKLLLIPYSRPKHPIPGKKQKLK